MSQDSDDSKNLLTDRRFHALIGLASGLIAATIAVLFFDGIVFWVVMAIAVLEAVTTPFILGHAFQPADPTGAGERVE